MKNWIGLLVAFLIIVACNSEQVQPKNYDAIIENEAAITTPNKVIADVDIKGMTCAMGCARTIQSKLRGLKGMLSADVIFEDSIAKIEFNSTIISDKEIIKAIENIHDNQYSVSKMVLKNSSSIIETGTEDNLESSDSDDGLSNVSYQGIHIPNIFDIFSSLFRL